MSEFDKDIQVGDIITAYRGGIHKATAIHRRFYKDETDIPSHLQHVIKVGDEYSGLIEYVIVMTDAGKPRKGKKPDSCDAAYCAKVDDAWIEKQRQGALAAYEAKLKMFDTVKGMIP